ncbi:HAD family hydrolase [Cohnella nanjingensis]|uniref:HAD-IA family hydrolase n=1 Tax=Cohnella nanjingensis TaxID=1387779 RepID=A0A7X0RQA9_9BACL|nr:HAD-IA family hydrolase [Cohnella nanjingensis]MBB6671600.1 HAD-IA family hydrolase [Cohnella nanjingensis]
MYKAILFDLDNTLLNYTGSELQAMQHTLRTHGLLEWERFAWERFWPVFGSHNLRYWLGRIESRMPILEVLDRSFRDTLLELEEDHALSPDLAFTYWEHFCDLCLYEEGAYELLSDLHGRYRLSVVSNGIGEAQRRRLLSGGADRLFHSIHVSDEMGVWKPDKAIFDAALVALGVDRSEALFVGDSLTDDYIGAANAGIDFCHYNPRSMAPAEGIAPLYTVHSLRELRELL